jgi:hypothetical protein
MAGNYAENSTRKLRNLLAREVRTAKYRARIVRSKKAYKRKGRVAQLDRASDF